MQSELMLRLNAKAIQICPRVHTLGSAISLDAYLASDGVFEIASNIKVAGHLHLLPICLTTILSKLYPQQEIVTYKRGDAILASIVLTEFLRKNVQKVLVQSFHELKAFLFFQLLLKS